VLGPRRVASADPGRLGSTPGDGVVVAVQERRPAAESVVPDPAAARSNRPASLDPQAMEPRHPAQHVLKFGAHFETLCDFRRRARRHSWPIRSDWRAYRMSKSSSQVWWPCVDRGP
jgi:hypothetical protein